MKKGKSSVIKVSSKKLGERVSLGDYFENEDKYEVLDSGRIVKKEDIKQAQAKYREMLTKN